MTIFDQWIVNTLYQWINSKNCSNKNKSYTQNFTHNSTKDELENTHTNDHIPSIHTNSQSKFISQHLNHQTNIGGGTVTPQIT